MARIKNAPWPTMVTRTEIFQAPLWDQGEDPPRDVPQMRSSVDAEGSGDHALPSVFPAYMKATIRPAMQTWQVRCARCKRLKWPYLPEKPSETYICRLCLLDSPRQRAARRAAGARKDRQSNAERARGAMR